MNATTTPQYKKKMLITYKVVMYMQRSHRFCNIHTRNDGPISGRKYEGTNLLYRGKEKIHCEIELIIY